MKSAIKLTLSPAAWPPIKAQQWWLQHTTKVTWAPNQKSESWLLCWSYLWPLCTEVLLSADCLGDQQNLVGCWPPAWRRCPRWSLQGLAAMTDLILPGCPEEKTGLWQGWCWGCDRWTDGGEKIPSSLDIGLVAYNVYISTGHWAGTSRRGWR